MLRTNVAHDEDVTAAGDQAGNLINVSRLVDTGVLLKALHAHLFSREVFGEAAWEMLVALSLSGSGSGEGSKSFTVDMRVLTPLARRYVDVMRHHGYLIQAAANDGVEGIIIRLTEKSWIIIRAWIAMNDREGT
ncbi:MAG: hypothetical protein AAFX04_04935 [Pseudomonadota bacterium]